MSKYLKFKEVPFKGKTKKFEVISKSCGAYLGLISWYPPWRQYTFNPDVQTVWNKDCLKTVHDFIQQLMDERAWKKIADDWHDPRSPYYCDGVDK